MKGGKFSKVTIVKKEWRGTTKKKKINKISTIAARARGRTKVRKPDRVCFNAAYLTHMSITCQ